MRLLGLLLPLSLLSSSALAATGGPDAGDEVYTDSFEASGPAHVWLDASGGDSYSLSDDALVAVDLPFAFDFYGTAYSQIQISSNGAIFFEGATSSPSGLCPSSNDGWTGIAAFWDDLAASTVNTETFGTWPYRTFVVSWENVGHKRASGDGSFQIWLMEGRSEAVVVLEDIDFGSAAVNGGASAVIGVSGNSAGLPYTCNTAINAASVWFGQEDARPARALVISDTLDTPWSGQADHDYSGTSLTAGDVNQDGVDDVLVGAPGRSGGEVYLLYRPDVASTYADADATFRGDASGLYGTATTLGDYDGDGIPEVVIGAPGAASGAGRVYLYEGGAWGGINVTADADLTLSGSTGTTDAIGDALLLDGDINNDGYNDLVVSGSRADRSGPDAGRVYLLNGGLSQSGSLNISTEAEASFDGRAASERLGLTLATGDLGLGAGDDLLIAAPYSSAGLVDSGNIYALAGQTWSGINNISSATCELRANQSGMHLGLSMLVGDADSDGLPDLFLGAPNADQAQSDLGRLYLLLDPFSAGCTTLNTADAIIQGISASAQLGSSVALSDINEDGDPDVLVSAPNQTGAATNSGVIYAFTSLPSGNVDADQADHLLSGAARGGHLGTQMALADDGDLYPTLLSTAPYADINHTQDGALYAYKYHPDFLDVDGDGFVDVNAGGNDCDDSTALAQPGIGDGVGDSIDDDCDGWVDGQVRVRDLPEGWTWDTESLGALSLGLEDFEGYTSGTVVSSSGSLSFTNLTANSLAYGTWPRGSMAAEVTPASQAQPNRLTIVSTEAIDGIALRILDPNDTFTLRASGSGGTVVSGYQFELSANDRSGGVFRSFLFHDEVGLITLEGASVDGWGIDQLQILYAADTDRDGDGFADSEGDCDDSNADISPNASEILGNSVDDDCDGIIDAGSAHVYNDSVSWLAASEVTLQRIDFETIADGESVTSQYDALGLSITDITGSSSGVAINGLQDGSSTGLTLSFTEAQPGLGFLLTSTDPSLTLYAYSEGSLLYSQSVASLNTGAYFGFTFDYHVDYVEIIGNGSEFFIDDIDFGALGLDDADNDGVFEPDDCDDTDPLSYLGATEIFYDGIDEACDGGNDNDADGDGVDGLAGGGSDCDDSNILIYPGATDTPYDGIDSDCSGGSDYDVDQDGQDAPPLGLDCDDTDNSIYPGATDPFYDGVDSDCAGNNDYDADFDGVDALLSGGTDCDDSNPSIYPGAFDAFYDGVDSDCANDNDFDADVDGQSSAVYGGSDCDDGDANIYLGATDIWYDGIDSDCAANDDYDQDSDGFRATVGGGTDCNDLDSTLYPGAPDPLGDGIDQNCSGDSGWDGDGDGYDPIDHGGSDCDDANITVFPGAPDACYDGLDSACDGGDDFDCDADSYYPPAFGGSDCDDTTATVSPAALDFPYDGLDADCDGSSEYDLDGDGQDVDWYGGSDCNDDDINIYVGATDSCYDGIDSNCDGQNDFDCDLDGHIDAAFGGDDCDDADVSRYPGATEIAGDGIDQNCDGSDTQICTDCDNDGFDAGTDCDDSDPNAYPGAPEIWYSGSDEACDGGNDFDRDGDGEAVTLGGGNDCNDNDPLIGTFATTDGCGNGDEDCDGTEDEDCIIADDTAPPDDTAAPDDTASPDDTAPTDDSAVNDSWRPDPTEQQDPEKLNNGGCGCASDGGAQASVAALGLGLVMLRKRRRAV